MTKNTIPTATELAILQVLWSHGPMTVREVHEHLSADERMGYTSALKMLQVMHKKGLVKRNESQRSHVYRSARPAEQTQRGLVKNLVDKAFAGSATDLVVRALASKKLTADEIETMRALIDAKAKENG
ncbi:MAG: BlaI/MecI/CopY family transcriptional regulator [Pseudomonadota bacterium]